MTNKELTPVNRFRVVWEIDEYATSPKKAAKQIYDRFFLQRGDHIATIFSVTDTNGKTTQIDLSKEPQ